MEFIDSDDEHKLLQFLACNNDSEDKPLYVWIHHTYDKKDVYDLSCLKFKMSTLLSDENWGIFETMWCKNLWNHDCDFTEQLHKLVENHRKNMN